MHPAEHQSEILLQIQRINQQQLLYTICRYLNNKVFNLSIIKKK